MAWFADLTPYCYVEPYSSDGIPPLNVGWLARGEPYPTGEVPREFIERLAVLVEYAATRVMRGVHRCDLCPDADGDELDAALHGCSEIRAVGESGARFAAPALIHHYVAAHQYRPPQPFINAVMRTAHIPWRVAYHADLCLSCATPVERSDCRQGRDFRTEAPVLYCTVVCPTCDAEYHRALPEQACRAR